MKRFLLSILVLSLIAVSWGKPLDANGADIHIDDTRAQKDIVLDISKNRDANAEIILKKYEEKIPDNEIIDEANIVADDGTLAEETGGKACNCFHGKKTDMLETQVKELRSKVERDSNTSKYIIGLSLMFYFCICVYYWFHSYL